MGQHVAPMLSHVMEALDEHSSVPLWITLQVRENGAPIIFDTKFRILLIGWCYPAIGRKLAPLEDYAQPTALQIYVREAL